MLMCPFCGTLLLLRSTTIPGEGTALACQTCSYIYYIRASHVKTTDMRHANKSGLEQMREELSSEWVGKPVTEILRCKNAACDSKLAMFEQMQIRSADEPPTTFYKCCQCGAVWRSD